MTCSEKLGLEPAEERPGGLLYRCGDSEFARTHTQMGWTVDDIEATVADLRRRGLEFEPVEMPGITVTDGIAEIPAEWGHRRSARRFRRDVLGASRRSATEVVPGWPAAACRCQI